MLSALMNEKKQEYVKIILRSVNEIMLEIYIYIYIYIFNFFNLSFNCECIELKLGFNSTICSIDCSNQSFILRTNKYFFLYKILEY